MRTLVAGLVFLLASSVLSAQRTSTIRVAHRTTHEISEVTITGKSKCSATAIAPSAILTASHCEEPVDSIEIDGRTVTIQALIRDHFDHTIYFVDATFEHYASFSDTPAVAGDNIFLFGNPGRLTDMFRRGSVAKLPDIHSNPFMADIKGPSVLATYYDFNGWFGDSGAAVFNEDGQIVGVVSMIEHQRDEKDFEGPELVFMLGFGLHFTPLQIQDAQSFVPTTKVPVKL